MSMAAGHTTPSRGSKPTVCPMHRNMPDLDRCEVCQDLHRDFPPEEKAQALGLKQSFPVVAQHSDNRLSHLEPQNRDSALAEYQKEEDVTGATPSSATSSRKRCRLSSASFNVNGRERLRPFVRRTMPSAKEFGRLQMLRRLQRIEDGELNSNFRPWKCRPGSKTSCTRKPRER